MLDRLLNTKDSSAFRKTFPKQLVVAWGKPERLDDLIEPARTLATLAAEPVEYLRIARRDAFGQIERMRVPSDTARRFFDKGWTLYFHDLRGERFRALARELETELDLKPHTTTASAFVSSARGGLPFHYDVNGNFVCQVTGKKRWWLAKNEHVTSPTEGYILGMHPNEKQQADAPHGWPDRILPEQATTLDMVPGMVMFVPKAMWHATETLTDTSVHINIQTRPS